MNSIPRINNQIVRVYFSRPHLITSVIQIECQYQDGSNATKGYPFNVAKGFYEHLFDAGFSRSTPRDRLMDAYVMERVDDD